jgi:hypothetical protein
MSQLLGVSMRAVQSFEQGWRKIPHHIERQTLFLLAMKGGAKKLCPCWEVRGCSLETQEACPAWEFQVGNLCWFINGTLCQGKAEQSWRKKMESCKRCKVFTTNVVG